MTLAGWIVAGSAAIQAVATIVLVAVTWKYVTLTRKLADASNQSVQEMAEQRMDAARPIIIVRFNVGIGSTPSLNINTWLENIGHGPAFGIVARAIQRQMTFKPVSHDMLESGGKTRFVCAPTVTEMPMDGSPPKAESPTIEIEYDDLFGRRWMTTVELDMTVVTDKFDGVHLAWRWRDLSIRSTRVRMVGAGTERPAREE